MGRQRMGTPLMVGSKALISVASALVEAPTGSGRQGRIVVSHIDEKGCDLHVDFGEPKLSKSGNSYLVTYDTVKQGALKLAVTAYIPLGRDRARQRPTRTEDAQDVRTGEQRAAERFFDGR